MMPIRLALLAAVAATASAQPAASARCPTGWALKGTLCLWNSSDMSLKHRYPAARGYCQGLNSDLVTIFSSSTNNDVRSLVRSHFSTVYIGLRRGQHRPAGEYYWVTGERLGSSSANYTRWLPGQPPSGSARKCVVFIRAVFIGTVLFDGVWEAVDCSESNYFMCATPATQPTPAPTSG